VAGAKTRLLVKPVKVNAKERTGGLLIGPISFHPGPVASWNAAKDEASLTATPNPACLMATLLSSVMRVRAHPELRATGKRRPEKQKADQCAD